MSTERTLEECWKIQLAYHEARGTKPPTEISPEHEADLRALLGDDAVEDIKAQSGQRS